MGAVSIKGLDKAEVLAALYNRARPQGMGFMQYDPKPMGREEAEALLKQTDYFDYLKGRVMKVRINGDELDTWGYDRDNGQGAAALVIEELRRSGDVNSAGIQTSHDVSRTNAAIETKEHFGDKSGPVIDGEGRTIGYELGLSDMAEHLGPRVNRYIKH